MARRIDIELTSVRDDTTWTWRAAGAKQPKGVVEAELLYPGAKVGDVVRADAEFEMDGITIVAVLPPKAKRDDGERLEGIGVERDEPGVRLVSAGPPGRGDRGPGRDRGDRPDRPDRDRG